MSYRMIGITQSIREPQTAPRLALSLRLAAIIGPLLVLTGCGAASYPPADPVGGGSCTGFAGMPVPDCDFSHPAR
jgi:hypothetical protein